MFGRAGVVLLLAGLLAALSACSAPAPGSAETSSVAPGSSGGAARAIDTVSLHGVSFALPVGWSQGTPTLCGPVLEHIVAVYTGRPRVAACPSTAGRQADVQAISLIEMFGPWGESGWAGKKITFDGQPAWVTQESDAGPVPPCLGQTGATVPCPPTSSAGNQLLSTTLALPWLNATIVVRNATSARTDDLLSAVTVHVDSALAVPDSASAMSVAWAADYDAAKTTTSATDIEAALTALRGLPPLAVEGACRLPATFGPVPGGKVVTFVSDGTSTSYLIANAPCGQVTAGTGTAGLASAQLYGAVAQVQLSAMR